MQSQLIIIWPADDNVYNMELRTSSMHCDLAQHHIFVRQSKTGTGRAACTATQFNTTSLQNKGARPRRDVPQWPAWLASPIAEHQQRLDRDSSFFILSLPSLSLYLSISVSLYLCIDISLYCHTIISLPTPFIHLIITISLTRSLTKSF